MNETVRNTTTALSRRSFLVAGTGAAIGVTFAATAAEAATQLMGQAGAKNFSPNAWVVIAGDGSVTIMSPATEMGQGVMTSLPLILAEELDVDWSKVKAVQSPNDEKIFGNPVFFGSLTTVGSLATKGYFEKMRLAGAQARKVLVANAAKSLNVPAADLKTDAGFVVHAGSGRKLAYAEIAKTASVPDPMPEVTKADLKPSSAFRMIGHDVARLDVPLKVNGTAKYGIDTRVPGMVYAAILHPDVQGEAPQKVDDSAAKKVKGYLATVSLPNGVAVVASTFEGARKGIAGLKVTWSTSAKARNYTSETVTADYLKTAADKAAPGVAMVKNGDADAALSTAAQVVVADFTSDHISHICMEPMNATALVGKDGSVEVWISNQSPTTMKHAAMKVAGVTEDKVKINTPFLGGGFGRRSDADVITAAITIAKAVPGKPVKTIWAREDDIHTDTFRPLTAQRFEIGLDADNNIVSWKHRIVSDSYFARAEPALFEKFGHKDVVSGGGGEMKYAVPAHLVEWVQATRGVNVGAWRGIAPGYTKFAIETLMDELAAKKGMDPLEYRIKLLEKEPRGIAVLKAVAEMSNYNKARNGTAVGIAFSDALGSYTAVAVEVSLGKYGAIDVQNIWAAVDPGIVVQPKNVVAQMEGSMIFGLSSALFEQITLRDGVVQQSNLDVYRVPRMSDIPPIQVKVISTDNAPTGVGEAGTPVIAPAIANAVAKLTGGKRLRALPMSPDRVEAALRA